MRGSVCLQGVETKKEVSEVARKRLRTQAINPGSIILLCGHMLLVTPTVKCSLFVAV
jgi:SepF-like predicted cell division protein (DUF552 family)